MFSVVKILWLAGAASIAGAVCLTGAALAQTPPPAPTLQSELLPPPTGNPPTEAKRVLGKVLFWDEQLSSDNTMSCGTCHMPASGGADRRRKNNFGPNLLSGTPESGADDAFGSPAMISSDPDRKYWNVTPFGLTPQATDRTAPSAIGAALFNELFWDGRACDVFKDPETNAVVLGANAALEVQSVVPPLNDIEMAHYTRTWTDVAEKLGSARPLALATALPADVQAVLSGNPTYPQLFVAAFGDGAISATRIAMAIATYERTLIPDQSPWDQFNAGDAGALNAQELEGLQVFAGESARCNLCHTPPLFSDQGFHALGVRPPLEDRGRQNVTRDNADAGRFRTPSLRNVGLRPSFFHNGVSTTLGEVVSFYANDPGTVRFTDNIDPLMAFVSIPPENAAPLVAFLTTGLTDPRVAAETFPFDKPRIWDEREEDKAVLVGGGNSGTEGKLPRMIAVDPPMAGQSMRLGVFNGLGSATATLMIGDSAPVEGVLPAAVALGSVTLSGDGTGTFFWTVPATMAGQVKYFQWNVADEGAVGGIARSDAARLQIFCPRGGCVSACSKADIGRQGGLRGPDGILNNNDFVIFIDAFFTLDGTADLGKQGGLPGADGVFDNSDFVVFIDLFFAGGC